jgi:glycosyltransferase involved in cell wall biosynthesis
VVIPAKDEERRIEATVRAAAKVPYVDAVIVVDDGSTDATADIARDAGAVVTQHRRNRGKAAAMESGAEVVRVLDQRDGSARSLLFLDADLEDTAAAAGPLVEPVVGHEADMTIAILPRQHSPGGGRGRVVRLSSDGIVRATGFTPTQPLSGQRCLTRPAFDAALPLAHGFGVETALTIDLLRAGFRVLEVEVPFHHRVTGTDWRAQVHRGRQLTDVARALAVREIRGRLRRGAAH